MMHPVGPQSAQTYWTRRILVGVLALALVGGLTWWMVSRGSDPSAAANDTTATDSTGVTGTDTGSPQLTGVLANEPTETLGLLPDDLDTSTDSALGTTDGPSTDPAQTPATSAATPVTSAPPAAGQVSTTGALPPPTVVETTNPAPATVTVTKTVTPTNAAAPTTPPKTTAPPKPSYDAQGRLLCPASSITLTGTVWGTVSGQQPRLGMTVTNTGKETCRQDVSGANQVYTIYTEAGERVWSTADCFPGEGNEVRTLAPKQKADFVIIWGGKTSEPGCAAPRVTVKPGKYKLVLHLGDLKSKPLAFTMK